MAPPPSAGWFIGNIPVTKAFGLCLESWPSRAMAPQTTTRRLNACSVCGPAALGGVVCWQHPCDEGFWSVNGCLAIEGDGPTNDTPQAECLVCLWARRPRRGGLWQHPCDEGFWTVPGILAIEGDGPTNDNPEVSLETRRTWKRYGIRGDCAASCGHC